MAPTVIGGGGVLVVVAAAAAPQGTGCGGGGDGVWVGQSARIGPRGTLDWQWATATTTPHAHAAATGHGHKRWLLHGSVVVGLMAALRPAECVVVNRTAQGMNDYSTLGHAYCCGCCGWGGGVGGGGVVSSGLHLSD